VNYLKGDYDGAISDYTRAIAADPGYWQAYNNRAAAHLAIEGIRQVIADAASALRIDPDYAEPCRSRGYAYLATGEYDKAIADFTWAITLKPPCAWDY
jgi:tetratricopeptide (TPR) repeat protein